MPFYTKINWKYVRRNEQIKSLIRWGMTYQQVADDYRLSKSRVWQIVNPERYKKLLERKERKNGT